MSLTCLCHGVLEAPLLLAAHVCHTFIYSTEHGGCGQANPLCLSLPDLINKPPRCLLWSDWKPTTMFMPEEYYVCLNLCLSVCSLLISFSL